MAGFESSTLEVNAIRSKVIDVVRTNNKFYNAMTTLFPKGEVVAGLKHTHAIEYSYTSGAAVMASFKDAGPTPDSSAAVLGEINKTAYHAAIVKHIVLGIMANAAKKQVDDAVGLDLDNDKDLMQAA